MSKGPDPTTRRSPAQGGREVHVRLSAEEYARLKATADGYGMTVPAYVRGMVLGARHRDLLPAVMAEVEAVDRPLPMAEAVEPTEAPCRTCRYATTRAGRHTCRMVFDRGVWHYLVYSGALTSTDGLPTNRTMRCPGWAAKETT